MSTIRITQPHSLGRETAVAKMRSFEDVVAKYRVKLVWDGPNARIKGTGVSGDVAVGESEVKVQLELGFLAKAAGIDAGRLEASLAKRLKEAVGPA